MGCLEMDRDLHREFGPDRSSSFVHLGSLRNLGKVTFLLQTSVSSSVSKCTLKFPLSSVCNTNLTPAPITIPQNGVRKWKVCSYLACLLPLAVFDLYPGARAWLSNLFAFILGGAFGGGGSPLFITFMP